MIDPVDKDISTLRSTVKENLRKSLVAKERVTTSPLMGFVGTDGYYDQDVGVFELKPRDVTPLESKKRRQTAQEALVTEKEPSPKEKEASRDHVQPVTWDHVTWSHGNVPEEDAEENDRDDDAGSDDENTEKEDDADGDEGEATEEDSEEDDADGDDADSDEGEGTKEDETTDESSNKESAPKLNADTDMSVPP
ncbi:PREDICTED: glutamic acid-rich protein-like [Tarenaya hassleriana]|uniref:glutamic acid-rich protein-like n=1 Tax=Tarenaya hassleriana TaxID=28532 RepID=UPI00053C733D|nr:PREDICTED: glutamic acid-rich protein-like [Tarenaya hassleriana]